MRIGSSEPGSPQQRVNTRHRRANRSVIVCASTNPDSDKLNAYIALVPMERLSIAVVGSCIGELGMALALRPSERNLGQLCGYTDG